MESNNINLIKPGISADIDGEEKKVFRWGIENKFSKEDLLNHLYEARLNSISRFLSSFLREFSTEEMIKKVDFSINNVINSYVKTNNINIEKIAEIPYENDKKTKFIIFIEKEYGLKRILINKFPILLENDNIIKIENMDYLIDVFKNIIILKDYDADKIREDLRISNSQLFLSALLRIKNLPNDIEVYRNIIEGNYKGNKDEMLTFFEQWCINGHLMHPTPKSKNGLSVEDLVKYSSEAKKYFKLELVAVKRDLSIYNCNNDMSYDDYMKSVLKSDYEKLKDTFKNYNLSWEDYYIIPVHPWQYSYILNNNIEILNNKILTDKDLFKIKSDINIEGKALISFRSLFLKGIGKFVKLPMEVQITSSRRHLSTRASHHAVYISKILSTIKQNNGVSSKFEFENENVSVHISKYIGTIYRESINNLAGGNNIVMPVAAFYENSPVNDGKTILEDLLDLYAKANNFVCIDEAVISFFEKYVKLMTDDVIRLLTIYGIALEAHLQNSIIVLENYSPEKVIIRDGEAINICLNRLKVDFPDHKFFPGSWNVIDGPRDCQKVIMHSLITSNIGQLIYHICHRYSMDEKILWNIVKNTLKFNFNQIKETKYSSNAVEDENYLLNDCIKSKSLFKMKIENKGGNEFLYVKLDNPLKN